MCSAVALAESSGSQAVKARTNQMLVSLTVPLRTMVQSQGPKSLTTGQLASGGNVGVETIRFYQRKNLLGTPARDGGVRRYGSEDVRRLRFIRQAQTAGFTLEEIKELLGLDAGEDRKRARELARDRLAALDAKIGELE
jgi:MerR family mercuric resistance operon transcriptional regulator